MGYLTSYNLRWELRKGPNKAPNCPHEIPEGAKFCSECGKAVGFIDLDLAISEFIEDNEDTFYGIEPNGDSRESVKWYDYDKDMRVLSAKFPNYLFTLTGEGEESGDLWRAYYLGGKGYKIEAEVTYKPFNEKNLE